MDTQFPSQPSLPDSFINSLHQENYVARAAQERAQRAHEAEVRVSARSRTDEEMDAAVLAAIRAGNHGWTQIGAEVGLDRLGNIMDDASDNDDDILSESIWRLMESDKVGCRKVPCRTLDGGHYYYLKEAIITIEGEQ
jgi:hypothetical protein